MHNDGVLLMKSRDKMEPCNMGMGHRKAKFIYGFVNVSISNIKQRHINPKTTKLCIHHLFHIF